MKLLPVFGALVGFGFGWWIEGYIWHLHQRYESMFKVSLSDQIHSGLVIVKLIIFLYVSLLLRWELNDLLALGSAMGFYFYFHQSAMYQKRHNLSPRSYPKGWMEDGSSTSTSYLDKKFPIIKTNKFRMWVFLFSIIIYFVYGITK
jgi:hypothetical protein